MPVDALRKLKTWRQLNAPYLLLISELHTLEWPALQAIFVIK